MITGQLCHSMIAKKTLTTNIVDDNSGNIAGNDVTLNPLDPSLLGITASPTEPLGAVDPIGDIIIDHILPFKGSIQLS